MPLSVMVARYIATYGYAAWRSTAFPTSDGFVPYWEWLSMMQLIPMIAAQRRFETMSAVHMGYVSAKVDEEHAGPIQQQIKTLHKQAFPEV
jgi:hypothetical protein